MDDTPSILALQARIAKLEQKLEYVMQHLGLRYVKNEAALPGMEEVMALIKKGNKIEAVKVYREKTNSGLKEAKDAVDRMAAQL